MSADISLEALQSASRCYWSQTWQ